MKFREWTDKISVLKVEIYEASESLYADGHSIVVTVRPGRVGAYAEIDGRETDTRYLRTFFTHNKENFEAMLESLTEQCAELGTATEAMVGVAAYDAIPGAVIDRLKGEEETKTLIQKAVETRMRELVGVASKIEHVFREFDFEFVPFGDNSFDLEKSSRGLVIRWGGSAIWLNNKHVSHSTKLEDQIMFLGNFDVAKERLEKFVEIVLQLTALAPPYVEVKNV